MSSFLPFTKDVQRNNGVDFKVVANNRQFVKSDGRRTIKGGQFLSESPIVIHRTFFASTVIAVSDGVPTMEQAVFRHSPAERLPVVYLRLQCSKVRLRCVLRSKTKRTTASLFQLFVLEGSEDDRKIWKVLLEVGRFDRFSVSTVFRLRCTSFEVH